MKYIFLALLITASSVFAMEDKKFIPDPAVALAVATVAAQVTGNAAFTSTVPFCLTPALFPTLLPVATATAATFAVYGAYKSGQYLYNRYTKPANDQQS